MAEEVQKPKAPTHEDRRKAVQALHAAKNLEERKKVISESEHLKAVHAYHEATTPEEKREVVKQYPWLSETFSEVNHA